MKRFHAAVDRAGVTPIAFHDLRHTFGTQMAAAGVPEIKVQEWMGHSDGRTTKIYMHFAPSRHEADWVEQAFSVGPISVQSERNSDDLSEPKA
jgi:integrase